MDENTNLDTLLSKDELLTLPEVADELGIAVTRVHDLLNDKKLIAHTPRWPTVCPRVVY